LYFQFLSSRKDLNTFFPYNLMQKREVSVVIVTVLLVLISASVIALIWTFIIPIFTRMEDVNSFVDLKLVRQNYTTWDNQKRLAEIQVERGFDGAKIIGIDLIFSFESGAVVQHSVDALKENSSKVYRVDFYNFDEGDLKTIKVAPIFRKGKQGEIADEITIDATIKKDLDESIKIFEEPNPGKISSGGGHSACSPTKTCTDYSCGTELSDGCNNVLNCPCNSGETCINRTCMPCSPTKTCTDYSCGTELSDGCNNVLNCPCPTGICDGGTCVCVHECNPNNLCESNTIPITCTLGADNCYKKTTKASCGSLLSCEPSTGNCVGASPFCGDSICNGGETCSTCPGDCGICSTGNIYFVSNDGNDLNNGRSELTPWRTISRVNSFAFAPGDSVYFRSGDTWRETLNVPRSGNSTNYITFSSYGEGSKPIISSAELLSAPKFRWMPSSLGENIFYLVDANGRNPNINPNFLWLNQKNIFRKDTFTLTNHEWTYGNADSLGFNTIYIRDNSGNPSTIGSEIEASVRDSALIIISKNYINIKNIHFKHSNSRDWYGVIHAYGNNGINFDSCIAEQGGWRVIHLLDSSNIVINKCEIHDLVANTRSRALIMQSRLKNTTISNNHLYNALDFDDVAILYSGRSGEYSNALIINNTIHDATTGNYIQYNTRNIVLKQNRGYRTGNFFRIRGISDNITISYNYLHNVTSGLMITAEDGNVSDVFLFNNFIYNINRGGGFYIWSTADPPSPTNNVYNLQFKNNMVVFYSNGITLLLNDLSRITSDHNLFYTTNPNSLQIWINRVRYDFNYWVNTLGKDRNSFFGRDPLVMNPTTNPRLQPLSPAINAGTNLGFRHDFNNKPIDGNPDIGAFEY
jgi:hypothetical protein